MADEKISALNSGSPIQDTDEFVMARLGDNYKVTGADIKAHSTAPIAILKSAVASATDLIDGQMYEVTGFATFTSTLKINRGYFLGKYNLQSGVVEMSAWGHVQISLGDGATFDSDCAFDWYDTGNPVIIHEPYYNNYVEGFVNINKFPFLTGTDVSGNKVGSGFTLDITALTSEKFNNNTCYGNRTFTAVTGRDYEGIDFTKGYFAFDFLVNSTGTPGDNITIDIQNNELGEVPAPAFIADGEYRIDGTLAGLFGTAANKFNVQVAPTDISVTFASVYVVRTSDVRLDVQFNDITGSGHVPVALTDVPVQVKVYF